MWSLAPAEQQQRPVLGLLEFSLAPRVVNGVSPVPPGPPKTGTSSLPPPRLGAGLCLPPFLFVFSGSGGVFLGRLGGFFGVLAPGDGGRDEAPAFPWLFGGVCSRSPPPRRGSSRISVSVEVSLPNSHCLEKVLSHLRGVRSSFHGVCPASPPFWRCPCPISTAQRSLLGRPCHLRGVCPSFHGVHLTSPPLWRCPCPTPIPLGRSFCPLRHLWRSLSSILAILWDFRQRLCPFGDVPVRFPPPGEGLRGVPITLEVSVPDLHQPQGVPATSPSLWRCPSLVLVAPVTPEVSPVPR